MKFLRLHSIVINPKIIRCILVKDTKYIIEFVSENINSTMLLNVNSQTRLSGTGTLCNGGVSIVIDKEKDSLDYDMLKCWINKLE